MGKSNSHLLQKVLLLLRPLLSRTPEQGALTSVYAAVNQGFRGGEYLDNCAVSNASLTTEWEDDALWVMTTSSSIIESVI
jgi:hypothetical protein